MSPVRQRLYRTARKPKSGRTEASIEKKTQPRLPHEHDESSDSQTSEVRPVIQQAHDDVQAGLVDTDRGVPMDRAYQKQKDDPLKRR